MMEKHSNVQEVNHTFVSPLKRRRPDKLIQLTTDGYKWRKYGRKTLMDKTCVRSYYKCNHTQSKCPAKKFVDLADNDFDRIKISYFEEHNHPKDSKLSFHDKVTDSSVSPGESEETFSQDSNSSQERNLDGGISDYKAELNSSTVKSSVVQSWNTMIANSNGVQVKHVAEPEIHVRNWVADFPNISELDLELDHFDQTFPFSGDFQMESGDPGEAPDPFSLLGGRNSLSVADFMFPNETKEN